MFAPFTGEKVGSAMRSENHTMAARFLLKLSVE